MVAAALWSCGILVTRCPATCRGWLMLDGFAILKDGDFVKADGCEIHISFADSLWDITARFKKNCFDDRIR